MILRQTALRTYLECALRFRFTYVDQIPARPSAARAFGRAFHRTLERYHRQPGQPLPQAVGLFQQAWAEVWAADQPCFETDAQAREYAALGEELLLQYLPSPLAHRESLLQEYPFAVEVDGHTLTGTIDRLDETPEGLVLIDYKTGKRRPSQAQLDDDLQFTCYCWGVAETLGLPVGRCEYVHLRKMDVLVTHRGPEHLQRLRQDVLPLVFRGIAAGVFPPSPHYWCHYCDYRYLCRASAGA